MPVVTDKATFQELDSLYRAKQVPICVFGTASYWNTEAILLAASRFTEKYAPGSPVALVMGMTYDYAHMAQCPRVTYSRSPQAGLIANMHVLRELVEGAYAPYKDVYIMPHLDHADPVRDRWALTEGRDYFASVMFDAQTYPMTENQRLTAEYVQAYGGDTVVEGIIDELSVATGHQAAAHAESDAQYAQRAAQYVAATGVDFVVADLGTEQQSTGGGDIQYMQSRARALSGTLDPVGIVLHGASSMNAAQLAMLGADGVARLNMWTRIARESGSYAAGRLAERGEEIKIGSFEAADSRQYLYDCTEHAAEIMLGMMETVGYGRL